MSARDNIPPLTVAWLRKRGACMRGIQQFSAHAPDGGLVMDRSAVEVLRRKHSVFDLVWLLRKIIGAAGEDEVWEMALLDRFGSRRTAYAAACVAAWREYHR